MAIFEPGLNRDYASKLGAYNNKVGAGYDPRKKTVNKTDDVIKNPTKTVAKTASAAMAPAVRYNPVAPAFVRDTQSLMRAQNAIKQNFANRGLGASSMFGSAMAQAATQDELANFQRYEAQRQFDQQLQAKWYEMLTAKVLQEAQIRGGFEGLSSLYPNQPASAGYLQNVDYGNNVLFPSMKKGPAGDPPTQAWSGFKPQGGNTLARDQLNASVAEANARIAIAKAQLAMQQAQFDKQSDPFLQAFSILDANWIQKPDGSFGWAQKPEELFKLISGSTGLDIVNKMTEGTAEERHKAKNLYARLFGDATTNAALRYYNETKAQGRAIWSPATAVLKYAPEKPATTAESGGVRWQDITPVSQTPSIFSPTGYAPVPQNYVTWKTTSAPDARADFMNNQYVENLKSKGLGKGVYYK